MSLAWLMLLPISTSAFVIWVLWTLVQSTLNQSVPFFL